MEKITFAVTFKNREYPIDFSLESLKEQLDPGIFFKANRNYIIHFDAIKKVHHYFDSKLLLDITPRPDQQVIIGKDKAASFRRWLNR